MAARKTTPRKTAQPTDNYTCGDCIHARDPHEIGADGHPFLCKCDHYTNGRYSRFLKEKRCAKHFKPKH